MYKYSNFAKSTLAAGIAAADTALSVASGGAFPGQNFIAIIFGAAYSSPDQDPTAEVVVVGSRAGQAFSSISRAMEGTAAQAWSAADNIIHTRTAGGISENNFVGEVKMHAGAAAPTGWLMCDGNAVSRTTYSDLFNTIGTAFGAGDGATTFNVPDFRSRSPIGAGQGAGLTNRPLGDSGGEEAHLLTSAESGTTAHAHAITDNGHAHNIVGNVGNPGAVNGLSGSSDTGGSYGGVVQASVAGITVDDSAAADAASAHNTMPPFLAVNFVIRW